MNLNFLDNKYFFAVFSILMLMYAAQIRQPLPKFMMDLFQNPIFRIAILFLVLVRGYKDPQFSLIVAVSFVLIMNIVNEQLFKESFEDTTPHIATLGVTTQNSTTFGVTTPNITTLTDTIQNIATSIVSVPDITTECFEIKQRINNIDACIKQTNLLDCSNETGNNKETCEKNNDDIIGLKATLGRKKYKTSENLNNKCTGINFDTNNTPSNNLVCKDI